MKASSIFKGSLKLLYGSKLLHISASVQAVDKASLSKLRKKTGFPFVNCKKALEKFDNNIAEAEKWLKDEAQKEGWAKATKLQGRAMSHGLVGVIMDNNMAAMVEVNCETDFVARNPRFQSLVSRMASLCLQHGRDKDITHVLYDKVAVNSLVDKEGQTVGDQVALEVGQIRENMAVRRAFYVKAGDEAHLGTYVHSAGPHVVKDNKCTMGKYGALVTFTQQDSAVVAEKLGPTELGRQLCQHIVGMNPATIGTSEDTPDKSKDNERKMIFQEFLLEPSLTVGEFLEQNGAAVVEFTRFECGEILSDEEDS